MAICYLAINDTENSAPPAMFRPFFVGLSYVAISLGFASNSGLGAAVNPARDFAGRVFAVAAGWDEKVDPFK